MSKELDVNEIAKKLDRLVRKCEALKKAKSGLNRYDALCYGELRTVDLFDAIEQINYRLEEMNTEILGCLTAIDWDKATGRTLWILYNRINMED